MDNMAVQLGSAFIGTLGFSLIFKVPKNLLFGTSFGGMISWFIYLILEYVMGGLFLPYMLASIATALYSEVLARIRKVPATVFLIPALIPSIPGGTLYYTMSNVVQKDWIGVQRYGFLTIQYGLAIAIGISSVQAVEMIGTLLKKRDIPSYNP